MAEAMPKIPNFVREINSEQLISGHMRIDLLRPMTKGNLIVMKGERNTGKTQVAVSIIKNFLSESPDHKAVYVSMSHHGKQISETINS